MINHRGERLNNAPKYERGCIKDQVVMVTKRRWGEEKMSFLQDSAVGFVLFFVLAHLNVSAQDVL